jgi:hypothetical protein
MLSIFFLLVTGGAGGRPSRASQKPSLWRLRLSLEREASALNSQPLSPCVSQDMTRSLKILYPAPPYVDVRHPQLGCVHGL